MEINYINTSNINSGTEKDPSDFIRRSEEIYMQRIREAAEKIYTERMNKPIVLLSGPSGSGKTTSALRIANLLANKGLTVHTVSMDNYFLPSDAGELPVDEDGKVDLESPYRLDIPLFSEHLKMMSRCEKVEMPVFDFATQSRSDFIPVHRKDNEIIIIEGIHALNPEVTGDAGDFSTCIYVSVRTRIRTSDGSVMHPRKIRLLRRLNRDRLFRGRSLESVFGMYGSVTAGEEKYIMPYKHRADFDIDTFIAYEASVYSKMLLGDLTASKEELCGEEGMDVMLKTLGELTPVSEELVPKDSLVREFVGGSSFSY
jgi:uridine kinase